MTRKNNSSRNTSHRVTHVSQSYTPHLQNRKHFTCCAVGWRTCCPPGLEVDEREDEVVSTDVYPTQHVFRLLDIPFTRTNDVKNVHFVCVHSVGRTTCIYLGPRLEEGREGALDVNCVWKLGLFGFWQSARSGCSEHDMVSMFWKIFVHPIGVLFVRVPSLSCQS